LRYKIVSIGGDYYYKMMSIKETIEKAMPKLNFKLRNSKDIDRFFEQNLNTKFPLDGPLWRMYV